MTIAKGDEETGGITPSSGLAGSLAGQKLLLLLTSANHPLGQVVRFGAMTLMSASVTVGLPIILHEFFGVRPHLAAAIAFAAAFLLNFLSLRRLVFRSERGAARDFVTFALSSLAFRGAEYVAFLLLTTMLRVHYVVALLCVLSLSALAKFFWYRRVMHGGDAGTRLKQSGERP
jgi:putative flippase GtrA